MKKIIVTIITLLVLGALWYLISPLFIQNTVEEELPILAQEPEVFVDDIIETNMIVEEPMMEEIVEPIIEQKGVFTGADNFHQGAGDLLVVRDEDTQFLRFENFSVTNGPDLFVTLNKGDGPEGEFKIVAPLKGNQGSQNYDISSYDLSEYQSVSIYCKAFSVEFATAELKEV